MHGLLRQTNFLNMTNDPGFNSPEFNFSPI